MNENFDPNLNPNETPEVIKMPPEELKKHKRVFSRIALSFFGYLIICEIAVYAIYALLENFAPELLKNGNTAIIISSVIQYCIAFPALLLMVRKIPKSTPHKGPFSFGRFIKYALVSIFVMFAGSYISNIIMSLVELSTGNVPEDSVNELLSQTNFWLSLVIVGIIGPSLRSLCSERYSSTDFTPTVKPSQYSSPPLCSVSSTAISISSSMQLCSASRFPISISDRARSSTPSFFIYL